MADNDNPFSNLFGGGVLPTAPPSPSTQNLLNALMGKPTSPPTLPLGSGLFGSMAAKTDFGSLFAPPPAPAPAPPGNGLFGSMARMTDFGSLVSPPTPPPTPTPSSLDIARLLTDRRPSLARLVEPRPAPLAAPIKRKAFFSFHFDDSMRVNVVRNAWKIDHPDRATMRSFQDSSLWEARKLTQPEAIKNLIRAGVRYTSAVCVLVGSETCFRRWVRYEIARAIIDGRGLLAVHLNTIRHHRTLTAHTRGTNPLDFMAIGKVQPHPMAPVRFYLFEKLAVPDGGGGYMWSWCRYADYMAAVDLPDWVTEPALGYVTPLSEDADEYDYIVDGGHRNIGRWIDRAAQRAGR